MGPENMIYEAIKCKEMGCFLAQSITRTIPRIDMSGRLKFFG